MNLLPVGWSAVTISETGAYLNGFPFKPQHRDTCGTPIIRIQNLTDPTRPLNKTTLSVPETYCVSKGTLLVSWSATLDVFIWRGESAFVNQHIFKVVEDENLIDKRLLFHWLKLGLQELQKSEHVHGSTMKHINRGPFLAHVTRIPPRAEQARIVEKLEELLSDLDAGVAELKAAQKKLALYRRSLLKAAVDGSLTAEWRKQNAPTETGAQLLERILAERRALWEAKELVKFSELGKEAPPGWKSSYIEPVPLDTHDLPALPRGWIWASMDHLLSEIQTGKSFKCEERPPHTSEEVGVVKVSAVTWGDYDEIESKTCQDLSMVRPELFIQPGDFLFSRANTVELVGACVIAKKVTKQIMLSDKILRLAFASDQLKDWVLALLRSSFGRRYIETLSSGNQESMRNISQRCLRQIPVPLPPILEFERALKALEIKTDETNRQESAIELALARLRSQRQNILRAAFSGQLVPQDPNDEPASVLLERIRSERAAASPVKKPAKPARARKAPATA